MQSSIYTLINKISIDIFLYEFLLFWRMNWFFAKNIYVYIHILIYSHVSEKVNSCKHPLVLGQEVFWPFQNVCGTRQQERCRGFFMWMHHILQSVIINISFIFIDYLFVNDDCFLYRNGFQLFLVYFHFMYD